MTLYNTLSPVPRRFPSRSSYVTRQSATRCHFDFAGVVRRSLGLTEFRCGGLAVPTETSVVSAGGVGVVITSRAEMAVGWCRRRRAFGGSKRGGGKNDAAALRTAVSERTRSGSAADWQESR